MLRIQNGDRNEPVLIFVSCTRVTVRERTTVTVMRDAEMEDNGRDQHKFMRKTASNRKKERGGSRISKKGS